MFIFFILPKNHIDKVARDIMVIKFIHSTGYSLGLDIHETPGFSTCDETIIEKGRVITVELGIYLEDKNYFLKKVK